MADNKEVKKPEPAKPAAAVPTQAKVERHDADAPAPEQKDPPEGAPPTPKVAPDRELQQTVDTIPHVSGTVDAEAAKQEPIPSENEDGSRRLVTTENVTKPTQQDEARNEEFSLNPRRSK